MADGGLDHERKVLIIGAKKIIFTYPRAQANLAPISKAFSQSRGNTSALLFAFFSGSKRIANTFE
jgi:hypothetical protein